MMQPDTKIFEIIGETRTNQIRKKKRVEGCILEAIPKLAFPQTQAGFKFRKNLIPTCQGAIY